MTEPDLNPPWVLFTDNGKPVAILPAMRPGQVCSVEGYSMEEAQSIVDAANRAHWASRIRILGAVSSEICDVTREMAELFTSEPSE